MSHSPILALAEAAIDDYDPANHKEYFERLSFFFPENLLLAALDLVDDDSVIKYTTPWGFSHYQVLGTTATYTVFPSVPLTAYRTPSSCNCPSFVYSVLLAGSHLMCKHVLATLLAQRFSKCIERSVNQDAIASIVVRRFPQR